MYNVVSTAHNFDFWQSLLLWWVFQSQIYVHSFSQWHISLPPNIMFICFNCGGNMTKILLLFIMSLKQSFQMCHYHLGIKCKNWTLSLKQQEALLTHWGLDDHELKKPWLVLKKLLNLLLNSLQTVLINQWEASFKLKISWRSM